MERKRDLMNVWKSANGDRLVIKIMVAANRSLKTDSDLS